MSAALFSRNGLNRLPRGTRVRKVHTKRYNKQVPGHHIQMDVKVLTVTGKDGQKIRRFQVTAINEATRIRALKVYEKHTQANAMKFVDHVIETFPFRIREIRTDKGHEFQAKFHWHVEDKGSPELNPVENIWHFLCQNRLANRVFDTYQAIVDVCCEAWNALLAVPERVASITLSNWAQVSG